MKRKLFFVLALILVLATILIGCNHGDQPVVKLEIADGTLPYSTVVDDFNLSNIKLKVIYQNNSSKKISLDKSMLSEEDFAKLDEVGKHFVEINYGGKNLIIIINLVKKICDVHTGGTATCTQKAVCTVCGERYGSVLEHQLGDWIEESSATCEFEGLLARYCANCDYSEERSIAALGHEYSTEWTTVSGPTCITDGAEKHVCTVCGHEELRSKNNKLEHNIINGECSICHGNGNGLVFALANGEYTVSWDRSTVLTNVVVPSQYNHMPVTTVGKSAFNSCKSLVSIYLPDSITTIGEGAFADCVRLNDVVLNEGLKTIYDAAFIDCVALVNITIPNTVASVGLRVFENCYKLVHVTNLSNKTLGNLSCLDMESRTSTQTVFENTISMDANGVQLYTVGKQTYLLGYVGTESVLDLSSYTMTTDIYPRAFSGLSQLTSLIIPDSIKTIGRYAFENCILLQQIIIPNNVESVLNGAFYGCESLTTVTIGNSVKNLEEYCFYDCNSLSTLTFGRNVKRIGSYAFSNCVSLTEITIPKNVVMLTEGVFSGCSGLTKLVIADGVAIIDNLAFNNCIGLTEVTLGKSVNEIFPKAFSLCSSLSSINVSAQNTVFSSSGNCLILTASKRLVLGCKSSVLPTDGSVTAIGDNAFEYCYGLTSITIPDSVKKIGKSAFARCEALTTIVISDGVKSIDSRAFWGCFFLNNVTLGNGLTSIGSFAFELCNNIVYNTYNNALYLGNEVNPYVALITTVSDDITECDINQSTRVVAGAAFFGCDKLTSILIPVSVVGLGNSTFGCCYELSLVTFANKEGWYITSAFDSTAGTEIALDDNSLNADNLVDTQKYSDYYWKRRQSN